MMLGAAESAALLLSLKVSLVATLLSLPVATWIAWLLARGHFRGKIWLSALVHLPLVLPPVVTGYALLIVFGRQGLVGEMLEQMFGLVLDRIQRETEHLYPLIRKIEDKDAAAA